MSLQWSVDHAMSISVFGEDCVLSGARFETQNRLADSWLHNPSDSCYDLIQSCWYEIVPQPMLHSIRTKSRRVVLLESEMKSGEQAVTFIHIWILDFDPWFHILEDFMIDIVL